MMTEKFRINGTSSVIACGCHESEIKFFRPLCEFRKKPREIEAKPSMKNQFESWYSTDFSGTSLNSRDVWKAEFGNRSRDLLKGLEPGYDQFEVPKLLPSHRRESQTKL